MAMFQKLGKSASYQTVRGQLATLEWGNPDGIPILAIHGWLDNAASFLPLAQCFDEYKFRLIAVDLPGHGFSDHRPPGETYHLQDYVLDIVGLMNALDIGRVYLLGHSLGGVISALVAAALPERITACIFLDALGPLTNPEGQTVSQLRKSVHHFCKPARDSVPLLSFDNAVSARVGPSIAMTDASARLLLNRNLKEVDGGYTYRSDPRLRAPSMVRFTESQVRELLQGIECPVLLVAPDKGLVPQKPGKHSRVECLRHLTFKTVAGKHHFHMETDVPQLAMLIMAYLRDNPISA